MARSEPHVIITISINGTGGHPRSWDALTNKDAFWTYDHYKETVKLAHEGVVDAIWQPDLPMVVTGPTQAPMITVDPTLLQTALSAEIPDIGFVPTISTTYNHPFTIARKIATLDVVSSGRAGVNMITSYHPGTTQNYGDDKIASYEDRHRRADEFIDLFHKLGESWKLPEDPERVARGLAYDPELFQPVNHDGEFYKVKGPNTVPQSRLGRPLVSVAGGSEHTLNLAAKRADVLYAVSINKDASIDLRNDVRARAAGFGRREEDVKLLPGLLPVIGSTQDEADRLVEQLVATSGVKQDPVEFIAETLFLDPKDLHPDRQLTDEQLVLPKQWARPVGFHNTMVDVAKREGATVGQLARRFQLGFGHRLAHGTPDVVAGTILDWWRSGAADGFVVHSLYLPSFARNFIEQVIPLLRKEGAYPDRYHRASLRSRFGFADA